MQQSVETRVQSGYLQIFCGTSMKKPMFADLHLASTLFGCLAVMHSNLQQVVRGAVSASQAKIGANEVALLELLMAGAELSVAGVAEELSVTRAVSKKMAERLSSEGFIESSEARDDRRMRNWAISERGRAFLRSLHVQLDAYPMPAALLPVMESWDSLATALSQMTTLLFPDAQRLEALQANAGTRPGERFLRIWLPASRIYRFARTEQTRFLLHSSNQLIDSAAYMVLYRIYERSASMTDIATFLGVDINTSSRLVERLERHGFLTRSPTVGNRRELTVAPTLKALELLRSVAPLDPEGRYVRCVTESRDVATRLTQWFGAKLPSGQDFDAECFTRLLRDVVHMDPADTDPAAATRFRQAMAQFATGVAVLSIADGEVTRCVTVNSITSVSLDPPTLLVCLDRRSSYLGLIEHERTFGVNFLSSHQMEIGSRFGRRESASNSHVLAPAMQSELGGLGVVRDAAVQMACRLVRTIEVGTHKILLAQPDAIAVSGLQHQPLLFWAGRMAKVSSFEAGSKPQREIATEQ